MELIPRALILKMAVSKETEEKSNGDSLFCSACQMAVSWMRSQIKNDGVKEKVLNYVNQLCESMPSPSGELTIDCNSLSSMPNVSFTIGGKPCALTPEQYIIKTGEGAAALCVSGFRAWKCHLLEDLCGFLVTDYGSVSHGIRVWQSPDRFC